MATDKYANLAAIAVTQASINTIVFQELRTQVGIESDRKSASAMIVDEIDYFPRTADLQQMTTAGDFIRYAITISNAVPDLEDITDRRILHSGVFIRHDNGTAGNATIFQMPVVAQFFPPIITAERALFLALDSNGLAAVATLRARIYHRIVQVSQGEFLELAEVFRLVG